MDKDEALALIDGHKNKLTDPVEMLNWTWLRVTILKVPSDEWQRAMGEAEKVLSK